MIVNSATVPMYLPRMGGEAIWHGKWGWRLVGNHRHVLIRLRRRIPCSPVSIGSCVVGSKMKVFKRLAWTMRVLFEPRLRSVYSERWEEMTLKGPSHFVLSRGGGAEVYCTSTKESTAKVVIATVWVARWASSAVELLEIEKKFKKVWEVENGR
jgi:hypothetical protein